MLLFFSKLSIKNFSTFASPNSNPEKDYMPFQRCLTLPLALKQVRNSYEPGFYSFNPRQYKSNYQYLLITTGNISHCLLQLQIIKSRNSTFDQPAITNSTHSQSK